MMRSLAGRRALVTGSTQGVGRAIAISLAAAGADVLIHGRCREDGGDDVRQDCLAQGVRANVIYGDLAGPTAAAVAQLASAADQALPDIDTLVSNAGTYADVPFLELTVDSFERTMRLNVASHFFLIQAFARKWIATGVRGRVLLIGSINGRLAEPVHAAYDTSKGAIEMMVKTLCVELAPYGIRVNGLAPGLFVTPLTQPALADPTVMSWMKLHTPNGQVPEPSVAGEAAAFLLSDAAQHIHGHMLMVDGGMSIWQQPNPTSSQN